MDDKLSIYTIGVDVHSGDAQAYVFARKAAVESNVLLARTYDKEVIRFTKFYDAAYLIKEPIEKRHELGLFGSNPKCRQHQ